MSQYAKLKTNLKLAIQRLKLLEKKKTELSLKSRKEISDYLAINKVDRARIRVEHIIREDNYVEAMEMLEMFCDMLLARFGLIEKMKELDPGLDESISTIIWSSPRISSDILEFKTIADILSHKYGKKYAEACKADSLNNVNEKVKRRLGLEAPPKLLVEQYLIEIAKNFNVDYVPDNSIMLQSGIMSEELIQLRDTVNDIKRNNNSGGGGAGGSGGQGPELAYNPPQPPQGAAAYPGYGDPGYGASAYQDQTKPSVPIGFNENPESRNLIDLDDNDIVINYNKAAGENKNNPNIRTNQSYPPMLPGSLPVGDVPGTSSRRNSPPPTYKRANTLDVSDESANAPPLPNKNDLENNSDYSPQEFHQSPPPSYNIRSTDYNQNNYSPVTYPPPPPPANDDDILNLPSVPGLSHFSPTSDPYASIEFDDLAKRFESLKNK